MAFGRGIGGARERAGGIRRLYYTWNPTRESPPPRDPRFLFAGSGGGTTFCFAFAEFDWNARYSRHRHRQRRRHHCRHRRRYRRRRRRRRRRNDRSTRSSLPPRGLRGRRFQESITDCWCMVNVLLEVAIS